MACQMHFNHFRHLDIVAAACHSSGHIHTTSTDGQHTQPAGSRRMAVGADQGVTRHAKPFQMHRMTDAFARFAKPDAISFGSSLDKQLIVKVFRTGLQHVVVDISH